MSSLLEIEAAIESLPPDQKYELLVYLAAQLRGRGGHRPEPRTFSREQIGAWIAEDESDMRRFTQGK